MAYKKQLNHFACRTLCAGRARDFHRASANPQDAQERILRSLLVSNRQTSFGRTHRFAAIKNADHFRQAITLKTYEDYLPWIKRIQAGEHNVLTRQKVLLLQPTGGSSGGSKLIPWTRGLQEEFLRGLFPWLKDIFDTYPSAWKGSSYWSISPHMPVSAPRTAGIPIGFQDDARYLGRVGALLRSSFAVPGEVAGIRQADNFFYLTSYFLLRAADLGFVSVWSPSFWLLICQTIRKYFPQLIEDIGRGTLSLPVKEDMDWLGRYLQADPQRQAVLATIADVDSPDFFPSIWPGLKLISCWSDGPSAAQSGELKSLFPWAVVQGKGLLATEGLVTFPLTRAGGCVPAVNSHFLEFLPERGEQTHLVHELENAKVYSVVMSTSGGLYRYQLGDRVKVKGFHGRLPLLEFLGRDKVSDLVGEKLPEAHVDSALRAIKDKYSMGSGFMMLAPRPEGNLFGYTLFLELPSGMDQSRAHGIAAELDVRLRDNFHYRYAREIGQLRTLKCFLIKSGAVTVYTRRAAEAGQKLGDIKLTPLDQRTDWDQHFEGAWIE